MRTIGGIVGETMGAEMSGGGTLGAIASAARRVQDAVDLIRGTAQSPDGTVRVEVGVDGRISELHLDPLALRCDARWLARAVVELHSAAVEDAIVQAQPLRAALLDDPDVALMIDRLDVAPVPRPTTAPVSVGVSESDSDDYYETFSVFRSDRIR